ncbi:hypothetical protein B0H14DRAFT_2881322 [Mycena olivaceomarginata]|nr:hypothetical protein B0H14DRAFT_2881322 [Mycena olivaceomarginata]
MLARLSAAASGSQVSSSEKSIGDERFFLDMETFRLVVSVPDITWGHVAQMCERAVNPMYKGLYSILEKDMEDVAHLLAALEPNNGTEPIEDPLPMSPGNVSDDDSSCGRTLSSTINTIPSHSPTHLSSEVLTPLFPLLSSPPCARQPRETSCQIPYQDSAFSNRLTVPTSLPSFNESFPPMLPPRRTCGRNIQHWVWKNGHWQAALKGLEPRPRVLKHRRHRRAGPVSSTQG